MEGIESVNVNKQMGHYGVVGRQKANALYKKYVAWMKENRLGVVPMKFTEWIKWASDRGIVKKFGVDADQDEQSSNVGTGEVAKEVSKTGKRVAWSIIGITAIALTIYLIRQAMPQKVAVVTPIA